MSYFKNFPLIKYRFGNEIEPVFIKDISVYVDLVDQLKDQVAYYANYTIVDGERPDTLAYKLYGDVSYYWTFFLLNPELREQGWPLSVGDAYDLSEKKYANYALQIDGAGSLNPGGIIKNYLASDTVLAETYPVGANVVLIDSSVQIAQAEVVRRNLDIGQIVFKFLSGVESVMTNIEEITYIDGAVIYSSAPAYGTNFTNNVLEYNAPKYYKNSAGDRVDIDPYDIGTSTSSLTPVTYQEEFIEQNDAVKVIKVFKKDVIDNVVSEFNRQLKNG